MSLKESRGNMYDWVTHTHSHLAGRCPQSCKYCYVQRNRFGPGDRYTGPIRLVRSEFDIDYGCGKIIFIEHMNDMFADQVPPEWIWRILKHCGAYPLNEYIFQTKNPERIKPFLPDFPKNFMIGTTIETNRNTADISAAPLPEKRMSGILSFRAEGIKIFVTIEPILDFDPEILSQWLINARPEFVNIGADSKGCGLREPAWQKIVTFINLLNEANVTIRKKINLERLMGRRN